MTEWSRFIWTPVKFSFGENALDSISLTQILKSYREGINYNMSKIIINTAQQPIEMTMIRRRNNAKILGGIIQTISIKVVHVFTTQQGATDHFFGNMSMFKDMIVTSPAKGYFNISIPLPLKCISDWFPCSIRQLRLALVRDMFRGYFFTRQTLTNIFIMLWGSVGMILFHFCLCLNRFWATFRSRRLFAAGFNRGGFPFGRIRNFASRFFRNYVSFFSHVLSPCNFLTIYNSCRSKKQVILSGVS